MIKVEEEINIFIRYNEEFAKSGACEIEVLYEFPLKTMFVKIRVHCINKKTAVTSSNIWIILNCGETLSVKKWHKNSSCFMKQMKQAKTILQYSNLYLLEFYWTALKKLWCLKRLSYLREILSSYTPWKHQKTPGFLLPPCIEIKCWPEMGWTGKMTCHACF